MDYNAVVDDYEFEVNGVWIEGLDYIKDPYGYDKKTFCSEIRGMLWHLRHHQVMKLDMQQIKEEAIRDFEERTKRVEKWLMKPKKEYTGNGFFEQLNKETIMKQQTVLQAIIAFVFGHKYYVNIFNRRGTPVCEISSFIFSSKEEAEAQRKEMEGTVTFNYVETVTFRSRNAYEHTTYNRMEVTILADK